MATTPDAMTTQGAIAPCDFEMGRYKRIAQFRGLYTWLIYVFSVVLTGVLALAVVLAFDKKWVQAAVAGTTSVVGGGGVKFLLARRKEAKQEEEAQAKRVREACGVDVEREMRDYSDKLKVFGIR